MRKFMTVMIGLPRSGKSTWAHAQNCPVINRDGIRQGVLGDIRDFSQEDRVNQIEEEMILSLLHAGHERVIIDATHLKPKYRNRWIKFCEDYDINLDFHLIATSLTLCQTRAKIHNMNEPDFPRVIRMMWEKSDMRAFIPEE